MSYTEREIQLIDFALNYIVNKNSTTPQIKFMAAAAKATKEEMQFAFNEMCKLSAENGILVAEKFGYGSYGIVSTDKYKLDKFIKGGGFTNQLTPKRTPADLMKERLINLLKQLATKNIGYCHPINELLEATGLTEIDIEVLCKKLQKRKYCNWHPQCISITTEGKFAVDNDNIELDDFTPFVLDQSTTTNNTTHGAGSPIQGGQGNDMNITTNAPPAVKKDKWWEKVINKVIDSAIPIIVTGLLTYVTTYLAMRPASSPEKSPREQKVKDSTVVQNSLQKIPT